jgi:hypothetical protein
VTLAFGIPQNAAHFFDDPVDRCRQPFFENDFATSSEDGKRDWNDVSFQSGFMTCEASD